MRIHWNVSHCALLISADTRLSQKVAVKQTVHSLVTYRLCCVDSYHTLHHRLCSAPEEKGPLLSHSGSLLHGCNIDKVCNYRHELGHLDEKACHCTTANSDCTEIRKKKKKKKIVFLYLTRTLL